MDKLGRYQIVGEVGRGAMGIVYKATDPLIERNVALKVVKIDLPRHELEVFREHFYREAKSAGRLNHPNIVTIYDVGESDGVAYIAMEYLEGRSLRDLLDSGAVLPLRRIVKIAAQVASGLAYSQDNGVVHRDIKPANIVITKGGAVKITDFGIALGPAGPKTQSGLVLGSPKYMSPEQVSGKPIDGRSDIFSLGVVLYEMLTGRPPFENQNVAALIHQLLHETPAAPAQLNANIPAQLDALVVKALAKDPSERYQSAKQLAHELRALQAQLKDPVVAPVRGAAPETCAADATAILEHPAEAQAAPVAARTRSLAYAGAGVAALLLALGLAWHGSDPAQGRDDGGAAAPVAAANTGPKVRPAPPPHGPHEVAAAKEPEAATVRRATKTPADATPPVKPVKQARAPRPEPAKTAAAPAAAPIPAAAEAPAQATLVLAVTPWGEVYVDHTKVGVSPPLREFRLPPGRHQIEIRNADLPPRIEAVELKADATHHLRHKFQ